MAHRADDGGCTERGSLGSIVHRAANSPSLGGELSLIAWLPPAYSESEGRSFPVLYWLPSQSGEARGMVPHFSRFSEAFIAARAIVVVPNVRDSCMYCDSSDGSYLAESAICRDLVPFIDGEFRTLPTRETRAIGGFSMGGFGAGLIGFKHPELFGAVVMAAPALHSVEEFEAEHADDIFKHVFGRDRGYCSNCLPETILSRDADMIRGRQDISILVGEEDFLLPRARRLESVLARFDIAHRFESLPGCGHDLVAIMAWEGFPALLHGLFNSAA